jgi:hypothetical protein
MDQGAKLGDEECNRGGVSRVVDLATNAAKGVPSAASIRLKVMVGTH